MNKLTLGLMLFLTSLVFFSPAPSLAKKIWCSDASWKNYVQCGRKESMGFKWIDTTKKYRTKDHPDGKIHPNCQSIGALPGECPSGHTDCKIMHELFPIGCAWP